jgi:hypothetical protein
MDVAGLAKRADGTEIGDGIDNLHMLKEELLRSLTVRYSRRWCVVHEINGVRRRKWPKALG